MAVGDETKFWWPADMGYWPRRPSCDTVEEIVSVLIEQFGYTECGDGDDGSFEKGKRKIAIFADKHNVPQHVAFQPLRTGSRTRRWKSKMGFNVDMEHELWAVAGDKFGEPVKFMCKDIAE
jgi:hypothetical protein